MSIVLVGSTSGSITLQEPAVAGTTVLTLPAVTGTVLTDTSPKAGNVIQVVQSTNSTLATNSSTSYTQLGPTASITPSSSSNKILVSISFVVGNNNNGLHEEAAIYKNSSILQALGVISYNQNGGGLGSILNYEYLDSPATTSSTTYAMYFKNGGGDGGSFTVNPTWTSYGGGFSTITLKEIAA